MGESGTREPGQPERQGTVLTELEAVRHRCAELERSLAEARRGAAALAEGEQKYRQLFATVSDAIIVFDAETRRFIDANESALRLYGYTRDEFLRLTHADVTAEPTASETSIREALTGGRLSVPLRYHRKKDGTVFPAEIAAGAFEWGGRRVICGVIRDITERMRVEAALWRSEATLTRAQHVAHVGSWHLDVIRGDLTWSDETCRIFGVPIGTPLTYDRFLEAVHPADREDVAAAWAAALRGEPYTMEYRILVGRDIRWVRESAEVEFDEDGTATRGIGTVQDITARKQADDTLRARTRQLEALRAVGAEITRELHLPTLLNLIMHRAVELVGGASGAFYLWDAAAQCLRAEVWVGHGDWMREGRLRLGEGITGLVAQRHEGAIVNDYRRCLQAWPFLLAHANVTAVVAEPLLFRGRLLGVLAIDDQGTGRRFMQQDREILRLFAAQAAAAIENATLLAAAERAAREARSLYEVAHSLTTSLDPMEVLHLIVVKTRELLGTPHGQVVLWDESSQTLRLGAVDGTGAEKVRGQEFRLGEGVNGIVAQTRAPLIVNDYQAFPHRVPELTELTAVIGIPLLYRGRLLGVLTSHTTQPGAAFVQDHLALLTSFADQAAMALENARLFADAEERATELKALREIGQAIVARLELPAVLKAVVRGAMELLGSHHYQIILWDEATRTLGLGEALGTEAGRGLDGRVAPDRGAIGAVTRSRQPLVLNDYQDSSLASPEAPDVRAALIVPVLFEDRLLGILHCHTTQPGKRFGADDLRRLQMLATQAAIAIENARLYEQVRRYAEELERKVEDRTRELQAANAELEAFSYSVSHDLRTPLVGIGGFSRVLLRRYGARLDAKGKDYLQRVQAGAQRMEERVDALLALALATRHPLHREPVDLTALARAIASDLRQRDPDRPAELHIQDGLAVQGDPRLLRALLENLLGNAWKFTLHRQPARIEVGRRSGADGGAVYFVRDNGVGFETADGAKLFGAFQRLHSAEQFPGSGIGLATVQRIVERHDGRVWAEGAVDGGATFFFTLGAPAPGLEPRQRMAERQVPGSHQGRIAP
ncbi:MAG TPA: GAF domain-containing protein [Candidatus Methylomirabilis sp.]|nr:GAF domain-containing protein [Candidatus Methylomirabilis sp.]